MARGSQYDTDAKPLPHSESAEADVIGCILQSPDAIQKVYADLPVETFYTPKIRTIYQAAWTLHGLGEAVDIVTVAAYLERSGDLARLGGRAYLAQLASETVLSSLTDAQIAVLRERYLSRQLVTICRQTASEAHSEPFERVLGNHEQQILTLHSQSVGNKYGTAADGLSETRDLIQAYQDGSIHKRIIPLGYAYIDRKWKAFAGDYIIVCGRPSMGKTALMMNMAERLAMNGVHPRPCGVISMEMSRDQLMMRMVHGRARVSISDTEDGRLTSDQKLRLEQADEELSKAPIYIDDRGTQTPESIRARIQEWKLRHGIEAVFVDYLGLISAPGTSLYESVTAASKVMKQTAKDAGVAMVVAAQLSRKTEATDRKDKRPDLADLRDSGAIEQDLDLCLGVYRAEYYAQRRLRAGSITQEQYNETVGHAEVLCLKARRGESGWVAKMRFDKPTTRFSDEPIGGADYA